MAAYNFDETQSTQVKEEFVGVTDSQEVDVTALVPDNHSFGRH